MSGIDERILDAAFTLTTQQGWSAVTMSEVAARAGVSRQSVYNEFGNRRSLARALVQREVDRFLVSVNTELLGGEEPVDALSRASNRVFAMASDNRLLRAILSAAAGADAELLPLLTSESRPVIDGAVAQVTAALSHRFQDLPADAELRALIDALVRVILSRLVQPGGDDAAEVDLLIRRLLD